MTSTPVTSETSTPQREGMFRELLYIHALLRRDLETVRRLANEAREGRSAESIRDEVRDLRTNSPLWRLKYGCLYYCRFVHTHHTIEDAALFPAVRRIEPSLNRVVDRLEEDHLTVHHITERIAAVAERVATDTGGESRPDSSRRSTIWKRTCWLIWRSRRIRWDRCSAPGTHGRWSRVAAKEKSPSHRARRGTTAK